jgi:hypothetical protein
MALVQPAATDTLAADNHTLMHQVFAIDSSAPAESVTVNASGQVHLNPIRIQTGTVITQATNSATLTAAQLVANSIFQHTGSTATTWTLDTGANVAAAVPLITVGECIPFVVSNASTVTITMAGASGTTLANAMTVLTLQSRTFYMVNTGTNTFTIY